MRYVYCQFLRNCHKYARFSIKPFILIFFSFWVLAKSPESWALFTQCQNNNLYILATVRGSHAPGRSPNYDHSSSSVESRSPLFFLNTVKLSLCMPWLRHYREESGRLDVPAVGNRGTGSHWKGGGVGPRTGPPLWRKEIRLART